MTLATLVSIAQVPSSAETLSSSTVPGRLEGEVDSRIVPDGARWDDGSGEVKTHELEFGVAISAAYDDNIYLSPVRPQGDLVARLSPAVTYRRGNAQLEEGGYLSFAYRPTAVIFAENNDNDRIDQEAAWEAGWRGEAIAVAYSGSARRLGDAIADVGTLTDRSELANGVRIAWSLQEKTQIEFAAGAESSRYDAAGFADSDMTWGEVALRYAYSPKTQLGLIHRAGRFEVDAAGAQTVQRTTGRIEWNPTRKIAVDVEAGIEHRSYDRGSSNTPVVEARVGWSLQEGTEIYVNGYRRQEASAFLTGQNFVQGGVGLGIVQRLGDKWTGRIEGGFERADYRRVSGSGPAGRVDRIHFIRPSLEYRFTDDFSMGLFYRYSENRSNDAAFGFENHSVGVEMGRRF